MCDVPSAREFDLARWRGDVRDAAMAAVLELETEAGPATFAIDADALRALIGRYDVYSQLDPKPREALARRLEIDVEQAQKWTALLNTTRVPAEQKRAALLQLIENMAANHLTNSILCAYVPLKNEQLRGGRIMFYRQIAKPEGEDAIDDFYTLADAIQ